MSRDAYRYQFADDVPLEEVEASLLLAVFAVESLHGEAQVQLDAGQCFDPEARALVLAADTPVGRNLNRMFVGFLRREFADGAFQVERVRSEVQEPVRSPAGA